MAEAKTPESLPPEVHDVIRNLVSAIRVIKLYPANNPLYSQSIKKAHESLVLFLQGAPEFHVEVQKAFFSSTHIPVGKETQLNRAIAQDLFTKGIREMAFSAEIAEVELLELCRGFALPSEELAMKGGISSILWEKGVTHIKVMEAGLDEVVKTNIEGALEELSSKKAQAATSGSSLVLGNLKTDPAGFGMGMVVLAKETQGENESTDDRLFALYHEAARKIGEENPDERDALFEGLAKSALALQQPHRDGLIAGKLYAELDAELVEEQKDQFDQQVPNELHEIVTGRFSKAWTVPQVTTLLKKSSSKEIAPPTVPPSAPSALTVVPLSDDLTAIAKDLAEYTPEEMEVLKTMGETGMESDIIEAAVRTLIFLLPLVKHSESAAPDNKEIKLFSGVVRQLEDMQGYLLKKQDYDLAGLIVRVFHMPVDPAFQPRMAEAIKKTTSGAIITKTVSDLRKYPKGSPGYIAAYSFLATSERETTEVLLELLAEETNRSTREFLMDILRDVGKNQLVLIGEHLSDGRWYFVRNIVNILSQSKTDHVIEFLQKVADHKNVRIRHEVVKGLISIGGKKAAGLLAKFLNDKEEEIQFMAIRGFAELDRIGAPEARPLLAFLEDRPIKMKERELTIEAIKALAKIGGPDARDFLVRYDRIRWWKPKKLQTELRDEALRAMGEIRRRQEDVGRTKR
jgi:HEAT repeat protein